MHLIGLMQQELNTYIKYRQLLIKQMEIRYEINDLIKNNFKQLQYMAEHCMHVCVFCLRLSTV